MSDLLRNHFHTKDFDFFNAFDWIVILAAVCGILPLIYDIIVYCSETMPCSELYYACWTNIQTTPPCRVMDSFDAVFVWAHRDCLGANY